MSQFLGTHQNRLDAKGRVSIPAPFRTALRAEVEGEGPTAIILRPSHKHACIEGWPKAKFEALASGLRRFNQFSDSREDLSATLYADAQEVEPDKEGRIVLDDVLVEHAGLTSQVAFMGLGEIFQIWEPTAAKKRREAARSGARLMDLSLPGDAA